MLQPALHPVMRSLSYYTNFFDFSIFESFFDGGKQKNMRHLIDPLDFSQQEITSLLDLADRICADLLLIRTWPPTKSWPPCSTSRPPVPVFRLRPRC